jgi:hypothetical protein
MKNKALEKKIKDVNKISEEEAKKILFEAEKIKNEKFIKKIYALCDEYGYDLRAFSQIKVVKRQK